jgi:hypothetical protein
VGFNFRSPRPYQFCKAPTVGQENRLVVLPVPRGPRQVNLGLAAFCTAGFRSAFWFPCQAHPFACSEDPKMRGWVYRVYGPENGLDSV